MLIGLIPLSHYSEDRLPRLLHDIWPWLIGVCLVAAAARFLAAILSGMKVQAKAGASVEALRDVAAFAVRGLRRKT